MKHLLRQLSLLLLLNSGLHSFVSSQDSLSLLSLKNISYPFNITNGTLIGSGADFLSQETEKAQFTMIGEYHGSKNISIFTSALIPELNKVGYKTLVLEVGPISGQYLDGLSKEKPTLMKELESLNKKYKLEDDGEYNTPIPFFSMKEDAAFLAEAKSKSWDIIGIDQEYCMGYKMLIDDLFSKLNAENQTSYSSSYGQAKKELSTLYQKWTKNEVKFFNSIQSSQAISTFLDEMSTFSVNTSTVEAFKKSVEIYGLNDKRKWYENNATRVKYMKQCLREGLTKKAFNTKSDKLLIKMGGYHLSKGFSPLALFEVGNTLNEIAEYNGNTALNIGFMNRYEMENNEIVDALDSDNPFIQKRSHFLSLGDKKEWIIVDLRPIRAGYYYYPQKYLLNEAEEKIIQRYDLLILTPLEEKGSPNY